MSEMRRVLPEMSFQTPCPPPCPHCKGQGSYHWRAQRAGGGGHASGWSKCESCKGTGLHPELQAAEITAIINRQECNKATNREAIRIGDELKDRVQWVRRLSLVIRWILLVGTMVVFVVRPALRDLLSLHWQSCVYLASSRSPIELAQYGYILAVVFAFLRVVIGNEVGLRRVTSTALVVTAVAGGALWGLTTIGSLLHSGLIYLLSRGVRWLYFILCGLTPFFVAPVFLHDIFKIVLGCVSEPVCWVMKKFAEVKCRFAVARILREYQLSPEQL